MIHWKVETNSTIYAKEEEYEKSKLYQSGFSFD